MGLAHRRRRSWRHGRLAQRRRTRPRRPCRLGAGAAARVPLSRRSDAHAAAVTHSHARSQAQPADTETDAFDGCLHTPSGRYPPPRRVRRGQVAAGCCWLHSRRGVLDPCWPSDPLGRWARAMCGLCVCHVCVMCHVTASASPSFTCMCLYVWTSVCGRSAGLLLLRSALHSARPSYVNMCAADAAPFARPALRSVSVSVTDTADTVREP